MARHILTLDLQGIGWKSSSQIKRGTTRVSIKKEIAIGLALKKGQAIFGYLTRCLDSNRHVLVFYPDGKDLDGKEVEAEEELAEEEETEKKIEVCI